MHYFKTPRRFQMNPEYTVTQIVAAAILRAESSNDSTAEPRDIGSLISQGAELPLDRAQEMILAIKQNFTMKILCGQTPRGFLLSLSQELEDPDKKSSKIGLLNYVPQVYNTQVQTQAAADLSFSSKFQGRVGEKIAFRARVIRCKYIASHGFFTALVLDPQGNVYHYSPKAQLDLNQEFQIQGRIKAHKLDSFNNNAETTYLNYVKILEE